MLIRVKLPTEDEKRISGFGGFAVSPQQRVASAVCTECECGVLSEGSLCNKTKAPTHRKVSGR